jgi:hypothetical protein
MIFVNNESFKKWVSASLTLRSYADPMRTCADQTRTYSDQMRSCADQMRSYADPMPPKALANKACARLRL